MYLDDICQRKAYFNLVSFGIIEILMQRMVRMGLWVNIRVPPRISFHLLHLLCVPGSWHIDGASWDPGSLTSC